MFKKLKLPALVLGAALMLSPGVGLAREHEREEHEHHRRDFSVYFGYGPSYYSPNYYANGYYDRWGRWHPYW